MAEVKDRIEMSWVVAARPKVVFDAWLDEEKHSEMTGGAAFIDPKERGAFTAWDGYIEGKTTKIDRRGRRIVQTWRTLDFGGAPDSRIEVEFRALRGNTQVILKHTKLKKGDGAKYTRGWFDFYVEPMTRYFGEAGLAG